MTTDDRTRKGEGARGAEVVGIGLAALDTFRLVERYPANDTKCRTLASLVMGGGPVATALAALSRLGVRAAFLGCLGEDPAGDAIVRGLEDAGVDASRVRRGSGFSTPQPIIIVEGPTGRRTVLEWHERCGPIEPHHLDADFLTGARALLCDARNAETELEAARRIKERGGIVMVDCGHPRPGLEDLVGTADVFIASHSFLEAAWGEGTALEEGLRRLEAWGAPIVGFTLGPRGSIVSWNGHLVRTPGFEVEVVDTTGAGDVFHGAFLFGMLRGWEPGPILAFANAAAALSCRALGGRGALPARAEVARLAGTGP